MTETEKEILRITQENQAEDIKRHSAHTSIAHVLKSLGEKKITARILPRIQAALREYFPETTVHYVKPSGAFSDSGDKISIWGTGSGFTWDTRLEFTLPKGSYLTGRLDTRSFDDLNTSSGKGAASRIERREKLMQGDAIKVLAQAIEAKRAACAALEALTEHDSVYDADKYTLLKLAD